MADDRNREDWAEPVEGSSEVGTLVTRIAGWLALAALIAACAYFFYRQIYIPQGLSKYLLPILPAQPGSPGLLSTYLHLFDIENYHYYPGNIDWIAVGIAVGAAAALVLIGILALSTLDLFVPVAVRLALAYVVGMGLVGVALEVETIFGLHSRESIIATLVLLAVLFSAASLFRSSRIIRGGTLSDWGSLRVEIARESAERFRDSLRHPFGLAARPAYAILFLLIAVITALTFYHGTLCPITYWDSMILYAGYARQIFEAKAFPFKAVAQVGIGLGANYPHLYALTTASTATVAGFWPDSDVFAQFAPPLAGLLTCVLVYHIALRLTRHRLLSLALAAIFRAVPYGIAYSIYASDYAFVMLFVAAFLYVAVLYFETGLTGYFALATLIPGLAMHINYLMGGLWIVWGIMILLAHLRPAHEPDEEPLRFFDDKDIERDLVDLQTMHPRPPNLARLLVSGRFWGWFLAALVIASPWYIRNWVKTGNPVYAFFADSLFPNTKNYNQDVMDSAAVEWTLNGDGIGIRSLTPKFFYDLRRFQRAADVSDTPIVRIDTPLSRKLEMSPAYWVTDRNTWKHAPAFIGLAVPGLLLFLLGIRPPWKIDLTDRIHVARRRFGWVCAILLVLLLCYHYLMADYYLYQIIPFVVLIPLLGAYVAISMAGTNERAAFVLLSIWIAVFVGLPFALMGFKLLKPVTFGNRTYSQFDLVALHHVGLPKPEFYKMAFGGDADAWVELNTRCLDHNVLTHENRHLVIDPRVGIVHFDDPPVQSLWYETPDYQLGGLRRLGIRYYLFMPNETNHQVNRRIGPPGPRDVTEANPEPVTLSALRGWMGTDVLELVAVCGENALYRFHYPGESDEPTTTIRSP